MVRNLQQYNMKDVDENAACPCCGLPTDAETFSLCAPIGDLQELGPGIPLYYWFVKYIMFILLTGFFVVGVACTYSNILADNQNDFAKHNQEEHDYIVAMSIGNHGNPNDRSETVPVWQTWLHIGFMVIIVATYHILRTFQMKKEYEIDVSVTTPSDYTLWVRGLEAQFDENEVKEFLEENGRPDGKRAEIIKTNIPYYVSDYIDDIRDHSDLKEKIMYIDEYELDHNEYPQ